MNDQERAILDAAIAYVVWDNKVPIPDGWSDRLEELGDELVAAVMAHLGRDEWWNRTYAPRGWTQRDVADSMDRAIGGTG